MAAPRLASLPSGDLLIDRIGADGDGAAALPSGDPVYLPLTLPGEIVSAGDLQRRGEGWAGMAAVTVPSPDRQEPPCPHFGACGGCTLQHWHAGPYTTWKLGQLSHALARAGFTDLPAIHAVSTPPGTRRRMDFAVSRTEGGVHVGLHQRRGRDVVDLRTCLVVTPALAALIGGLRTMARSLDGLRQAGSAVVNTLDSGMDLLLRTDAALSARDRAALALFAAEAGLCRVSWALNGGPAEVAAQLRPATVHLAGVQVAVPPGAFLQASAAGEAAITAAVLAGLPTALARKARIIELFAGCGTLTFALAAHAHVLASEGDAAAAAALKQAGGGHRVSAERRDLARQPLTAKEMTGASAIVLDPPYAGAVAQMAAIAGSGVKRVIYVSCNPGALARDARVLQQAGYQVTAATMVDQFLWSAQVEGVVVFSLPPRNQRVP